jgi:hypothetical protein
MENFKFVLPAYNKENIQKKHFKNINVNLIRKNRIKAHFNSITHYLWSLTLKKIYNNILNAFNDYWNLKKKFISNIPADYPDFKLNNKKTPKIHNNNFRITGGFL